jgi:UDP-N-acetylglucosamine 2-epimerase (non-hydrolysing)
MLAGAGPLATLPPVKRVLVVLGTRPEAIKLAPVLEQLAGSDQLVATLVSSAQQQHLVDQALEPFGLRPDIDLEIERTDGSLQELTAAVVTALPPVLADVAPDIVLVQGDTTTTFVAALAAFYAQIPVVHLEAGLRTDDPAAPFPEEINRRLTTDLASLHLAPTASAAANLERAGVRRDAVVVTGNTVIDALHGVLRRDLPLHDQRLLALAGDPRRLVLVTTHRRESWAAMPQLAEALATLAQERPDVLLLLPLHPNPVVRDVLSARLGGLDNVLLTEPLGYTDFVRVLSSCYLALTDSGGVQEEGPSLGKPVLVMRDVTERPEAVAAGTARLVGTRAEHIVTEVVRLLDDTAVYTAMATAINPYGDGRAAPRAVAAIEHYLGLGARP